MKLTPTGERRLYSNLDIPQERPWHRLPGNTMGFVLRYLSAGAACQCPLAPRILVVACLAWLSTSLEAEAAELAPGSDPAAFPARNGVLRAEVARIERVGRELMLTTYCDEIQSIYVQPTAAIDLRDYLDHYVRVTYTMKEEAHARIRCTRAPCGPVMVKKALILEIEKTDMTDERLRTFRVSCTPAGAAE